MMSTGSLSGPKDTFVVHVALLHHRACHTLVETVRMELLYMNRDL